MQRLSTCATTRMGCADSQAASLPPGAWRPLRSAATLALANPLPEKPRKRVTPLTPPLGARCCAAFAKLPNTTLSEAPGMCCGPVVAGSSGAPWLLLLLLLLVGGSFSASREAAEGCTACGQREGRSGTGPVCKGGGGGGGGATLCGRVSSNALTSGIAATPSFDRALTRVCCRARQAAAGAPSAARACEGMEAALMTPCTLLQVSHNTAGAREGAGAAPHLVAAPCERQEAPPQHAEVPNSWKCAIGGCSRAVMASA